LDDRHSKGKFLAVVVKFHVMKLKIEDIPLPAIDRFITNSIFGFSFRYPGRPSIWLEPFLITERTYLVSYLFVVLFKMEKPGKLFTIPKLKYSYHHGWARSPGIISGHPFWRGEVGWIYVLLILASSQGLILSTLELFLSAKCTLMNLVTATLCKLVRKYS